MGTARKIIFGVITLVFVAGGYFFGSSRSGDRISTQTSMTDVYTNEEYGFRFSYPQEWHAGADNLGAGALQLFNYKESEATGSKFSPGMNKIEVVVAVGNPYESTSDYPEKDRQTTEVSVAGREVIRTEIEFLDGQKILGYLIPLNNDNGNLAITVYGDPENFYILENLVAGFEFVK